MSSGQVSKASTVEILGPALARLYSLEDNWDSNGAPAPNDRALALAERVFSTIAAATLRPDRIVASAEGGVAFVFANGDRVADIEALNSGELLASTVDYGSDESRVWELTDSNHEIVAATETFRKFLA